MAQQDFKQTVTAGYTTKGAAITLGAAVLNGTTYHDVHVVIPLATLNRHGLVAGATGTGKTKTLQKLAEQFSKNGIPSLVMDVKGDFSGIAVPGAATDIVSQRSQEIGIPWQPQGFPVEFLSITDEAGVRMRATVSEFGPVLLAKMLELNDTQEGVLALIFKWCDDNGYLLIDLKDLTSVLQYLTNEGKDEIKSAYGSIGSTSAGTIMRKVIELEQQGAEQFFGEPSFDVQDLVRTDSSGNGMINIMRVAHLQSHPKYFSTFMLSLLTEIYQTFPEEGDMDKPKLMLIIDEAHLIFNEASNALIDEIETIIKLIRSKGVGIIFCTQLPTDIPQTVLSQLGLKVQHALRAFTAQDRKAIKLVSENYPETSFYTVDQLITELGIGEALVTALSEKGTPTPLVQTKVAPPESRMDTISDTELQSLISRSALANKYAQPVDRETAYEKLAARLSKKQPGQAAPSQEQTSGGGILGGLGAVLGSPMAKQVIRSAETAVTGRIGRAIVRGVLGSILGGKSSSRY